MSQNKDNNSLQKKVLLKIIFIIKIVSKQIWTIKF